MLKLIISYKNHVLYIILPLYFFIAALYLNALSLDIHLTRDFLHSRNDAFLGTVTWISSLFLLGMAILLFSLQRKKYVEQTEKLTNAEKLVFFLLLVLGLVLRLYKIKHQGFYLDERFWIMNAKGILDGTIQTPFGFIGDQPSNMPSYIVALFYVLTHDVYLAVRLPGIFYSLGTICFIFLFVKEAYNKKAAFLSTLLLTTSIWDIHMSQLGWNNVNLNPFLISATLLFLYRSIKHVSFKNSFLCGIFLGISINLLYIAALSVIIAVVYWIFGMVFRTKRRALVVPLIIFFATTFMTASPTIAKIVRYPELSIKRHKEFLQQNENYSKLNNGILYYINQIQLAISDLGYSPDKYGIVMLWGITIEPIILFFFFLGILYMLRHIKYFPNSIVLLEYVVMFIPVVVLYRFTSAWREYGFVPSLYIIASLGAYVFLQPVLTRVHYINRAKAPVIGLGVMVILYMAQWTYYFHNYYIRSLQDEPVMYETVCKNTTSYIEKYISRQTVLYFPNELCSDLITAVLNDRYRYITYNNLFDLQNIQAVGSRSAIIVFTKENAYLPAYFGSKGGAGTNPDIAMKLPPETFSAHRITGGYGFIDAIIYTRQYVL